MGAEARPGSNRKEGGTAPYRWQAQPAEDEASPAVLWRTIANGRVVGLGDFARHLRATVLGGDLTNAHMLLKQLSS
jgi:hypothetical protein